MEEKHLMSLSDFSKICQRLLLKAKKELNVTGGNFSPPA
jgi:hypothetical protein